MYYRPRDHNTMNPLGGENAGQGRTGNLRRSTHQRLPGSTPPVSRSLSGIRRLTSDESWIEVSSQPSSSSLSSAATDEVITTGLRLTQSVNARRRRRLHRSTSDQMQILPLRPISAAGSSQEEYDESESESDRIMSSSNEGLQTGFHRGEEDSGRGENINTIHSSISSRAPSMVSDEDGTSSALGIVESSPAFAPQPNAFSHPPSRTVYTNSRTPQTSYSPPSSTFDRTPRATLSTATTTPSSTRQSYPRAHTRTRSHTPYTLISPNHTIPIDHDAALRASLSTLLSCAAAARGLQKRDITQDSAGASAPPLPTRPRPSNRMDQGTLRLVPESTLDDEAPPPPPPLPSRPSPRSSSQGSAGKRKSKSPSHDRRKKRRTGLNVSNDDLGTISPTLMTWVVGAGVVVLFSAISFSAGYALGREVGRVEALGAGGLGCARETDAGLTRGLGTRGRGWRWGNASGIKA